MMRLTNLTLVVAIFQLCKAQEQSAKDLLSFRQQHRKTIDGRLCAGAFVQDDQTYTDCTDARNPEGSSGREWCYVEVQLLGKGPKDWNYCAPPVNYDKVREKANELFEMKAATTGKMVDRIDKEIFRIGDMMSRFSSTCGGAHEETSAKLDKIDSLLSRSQHCLKKVNAASGEVGVIEGAIEQIREDIDNDRKESLTDPANCEFVQGYEDDPTPDGIRGAYYDNPLFEGTPSAFRTDRSIDFNFAGKGPAEGISPHKFSIRWDGYIVAPHSGNFIFATESSSGARLFLNEQPVIIDRMPEATEIDAIGDKSVATIPVKEKSGIQKVESAPLELVGGEKYSIRLEMIHSTHLKYSNPTSSTARLFWKSGILREELVPQSAYFTTNAKSPVKISGLNPQHFELSILQDGERAFADAENFYIADVPQRYQGLRLLRTLTEPNFAEFDLSLNSPSTIYFASLIEEPLPIETSSEGAWKAHDTEDVLSIYHGRDATGRAIDSQTLRIRFISMREGGKIGLKVSQPGAPFLIFVEAQKEKALSCGGEEEVVSLVGGPAYADCESSSSESSELGCSSGLNGKHMDQPNGVWRSIGGNGVGEYIAVKFRRPVQIDHFRFKPRDDTVTWPSEITLSYSAEGDEDAETFPIPYTSNMEQNTHKLRKPVVTKYIKATITQMYTNGQNSGGSFEFLGTPCSVKDNAVDYQAEIQHVKIERCDATVESLPEILPLQEGDQFIALCPTYCTRSLEGFVYGDGVYSPESTICTAGVHAGICAEDAPICSILVNISGAKNSFRDKVNNGVTSLTHGPSDASIVLTKAPCPSEYLRKDNIHYNITFGNKIAPQGWLVDDGSVRQSHEGIVFGWMVRATPENCGANNGNNLNGSSIAFPTVSSKLSCPLGSNCSPNFWSIILPENGKYKVEVQLGIPCGATEKSEIQFQVNGLSLVEGVHLQQGEYYTAVAEVDVKEKIMVFSSTCDGVACEVSTTTIVNASISKIA